MEPLFFILGISQTFGSLFNPAFAGFLQFAENKITISLCSLLVWLKNDSVEGRKSSQRSAFLR